MVSETYCSWAPAQVPKGLHKAADCTCFLKCAAFRQAEDGSSRRHLDTKWHTTAFSPFLYTSKNEELEGGGSEQWRSSRHTVPRGDSVSRLPSPIAWQSKPLAGRDLLPPLSSHVAFLLGKLLSKSIFSICKIRQVRVTKKIK